jgi:hypothetical protein
MATEISKAIFFHMPRTGGTWLLKLLNAHFECGSIGLKHTSPSQFLKVMPGSTKYRFSFTRNPVNWYISKFSSPTHIRRLKNEQQSTFADTNPVFVTDATDANETFQDWVGRHLSERPGWLSNFHEWFYGKNYEFIDYIGTYENQISDLRQVFKNCGQRYPVGFFKDAQSRVEGRMSPKIRVSRKKDCKYTKPLLKALIEAEEPLFKKFGYSTKVEDYLHLLS